MKKPLLILLITSMIGCSSTEQTTPETITVNEPPAMPESYQTMVDFGIISENDALKVVNGQRKALSDNLYKFKESVLGQITDGGDMFVGFGIAQLLGGGVALTDFFNPLSIFRSTAHENHLKKTYLWVEVEKDCDRDCGFDKIEELVSLAAEHYADNLIQLSKSGLIDKKWTRNDDTASPLYEVETFGAKKDFWGETLSRSYQTDLVVAPDNYLEFKKRQPFFTVWDADFKYINGKRYFGSKVTTRESFTVSLRRMGQHFRWDNDNSKTFGFAKASEVLPNFILIETQNCVSEFPIGSRDRVVRGCQGDLMIAKGKVTYMHLFANSTQKNLDISNMIGAQIHDAREEIFTEEEWKSLLEQNSPVKTAGRAL